MSRSTTRGGGRGGTNPAGPRGQERRNAPPHDRGGSVIGFVLRLLVGWGIAIGILAVAPGIEHWAVLGTVGSVSATLRLATFEPTISGTTITLGSLALRIIPECTPLMPGLLLATAMLAYPSPWPWKLAGIGAGVVVLWLFNVLRMLALFGTLAWWPGSFKFMHVYLWQTITLLVVCALFLVWLRFAPPRGSPR